MAHYTVEVYIPQGTVTLQMEADSSQQLQDVLGLVLNPEVAYQVTFTTEQQVP